MKHSEIFKAAQSLYKEGFAIHWLHEKSKRPIESGWTSGPRKEWGYLKETYIPGLNVGTRLGSVAEIDGAFHAVVDVDVKSEEKRHRIEAHKAAYSLFPEAWPRNSIATVTSGRGNGSMHLHCLTKKTFKTWNPFVSEELVKVHMPSKKPSKKELEQLTEKEIKAGMRIAPAWEVSLYSDGRQVVLPPSIHPDTGKPYQWKHHIDSTGIGVVEFPDEPGLDEDTAGGGSGKSGKDYSGVTLSDFEVCPVDLGWLQISDKIKKAILHGEGVTDRSAYMLPAAKALLAAGLTKNEILTVLTDPNTFLGACGYDHAKTRTRSRAAYWVFKYSLKKILEERDPKAIFSKVEPNRKLSKAEREAQDEKLEEEKDWRDTLEATDKGKYRNTLNNCKTIITNVCGQKNVVGRNEFAANDYYLCDTPWRSKKGDAVTDADIHRIKFFCTERFNIEFGDNTINQTLQDIADINRFHPVRTWLNTLEWDGVARIDTWLKDYAGAIAPDPYLSDVSRKVLCAMVQRVMQPGCKFDFVLVLEGLQGIGKSTFLRFLAGDAWFSDATLNIGDKDAVLTMQSKWLIELGELASMGRADLEQLKLFISQTTDRIRAPYGKRIEEFPRQGVFIGSTNQDEYLRDLTGNRRFWPVKVSVCNFDGLKAIREQLFAEAVAFYKLGEPLYLENPVSAALATGEQNKRAASDEWVGVVSDIINGPGFPVNQFEMRDVAKRMDQVGAHKLSHSDVQRLMRCFKILGCENWRETGGARRRLWRQVALIPSEVVQGSSKGTRTRQVVEIEDFY